AKIGIGNLIQNQKQALSDVPLTFADSVAEESHV
ncbi:ribonuclease PH, partial [Mesorhizobium sp. M00.F.Ca.ET.186.01.1.1]